MRVINADTPYEGPGSELGSGATGPTPGGPQDLNGIFHARAMHWSPKHQEMTRGVDIYNGIVPDEYSDLVDEDKLFHLINMFRLSADDLAGMAGKEFPLYSREENDTATAKARAEKREHIMYGYNAAGRKNGGVDMAGLSTVFGWWLAVAAECVGLVLPDHRRKTPYFTFRDPRTHFAPVGWNQWEQSDLDGTLFAYQMTLGEIKRRYPDHAAELNTSHTRSHHALTSGWNPTTTLNASGGDDDLHMVWVGEYYHSEAWYVATLEELGVTLLASETGDKGHTGVCPAVGYQVYNPEQSRGLLADQIGLQIAESRMLSQQLHHNDRINDPPIFGSKLLHDKVRWGPRAYNPFDESASQKPVFFQASPPSQINTQQMMELGMVLLRMLNRNPESFQGAGEANSAKAVSELKAGVSETVKNVLWPPLFQGHPQLYGKAIRTDINLWGQDRKEISGRTPDNHLRERGTPVSGSYRPITDLAGHEDSIEIEPGIILRGYQGRLEIMQLKNSGLMSEDTALEQLDVVRNPQEEKRKIQKGMLEQLEFADIATKAQKGEIQPGAITKLMTMMGTEGMDLFEAKGKLEEKGEFYVPPAPPPAMPGMPGLPAGPEVPPMLALGPGPEPGAVGESLEQGATAPPLDVLQGELAS